MTDTELEELLLDSVVFEATRQGLLESSRDVAKKQTRAQDRANITSWRWPRKHRTSELAAGAGAGVTAATLDMDMNSLSSPGR